MLLEPTRARETAIPGETAISRGPSRCRIRLSGSCWTASPGNTTSPPSYACCLHGRAELMAGLLDHPTTTMRSSHCCWWDKSCRRRLCLARSCGRGTLDYRPIRRGCRRPSWHRPCRCGFGEQNPWRWAFPRRRDRWLNDDDDDDASCPPMINLLASIQ